MPVEVPVVPVRAPNLAHVLAAVRALNRLECVTETMRHALESLAVAAPDSGYLDLRAGV